MVSGLELLVSVVNNPVDDTVAKEVFEEDQVTLLEILAVELSEYVAVATNCSDLPIALIADGELTAIDVKTGAVTVKVTALETPLVESVAVMTEVPVATPVTRPPALPDVTVATLCVVEVQVRLVVIICVVPFE